MKSEINTLAIYGSKARLDFDKYSDNDLLIIADKFENQFEVEDTFNKKGFSCSAYTFKRLQHLADRKVLFIQHLKQEAKIIYDGEGKFYSLLNGYKPKENYDTEIDEAKKYFKLLKYIPDSKLGIGWAFDIIAIGIRNYNILELANHKIYEFSLERILESTKTIFNLTQAEIELLINTRIAKKNYRNKFLDLLPSKQQLINTIKLIENKYSISINCQLINYSLFNDYSFEQLYHSTEISSYQKLRLFEAFILTNPHNINPSVMEQCTRIIENPKFYASSFKNQNYIDNLLMNLYDSP